MWNLNMTQMNISTKQKQTHRYTEQTCGYQAWGRDGGGQDWEFGINRCKLYTYRMDKKDATV